MSNPWDILKDGILDMLKNELTDILEDGAQNIPFMADISEDMAKQWYLLSKAQTPEEQQKHKDNIKALKVTVRIRARAENIKIKRGAEALFEKVFSTALSIILNTVLPL